MVEQRQDARRGPVHRLRRALGRERAEPIISTAKEPCAGCGEETAIGSVCYSDRHEATLADGRRLFLCSDCLARAHAARKSEPLTDEDLRTIADNGLLMGVGFWGSGGG